MSDDVIVEIHGPEVTIDDVIRAASAIKELVKMGFADLEWVVTSVQFMCDGCGLLRPDRPAAGEGWSYVAGDDFCPECTAAAPTSEETK